MVDRNRALKIESVAEFGSATDYGSTETAPNSDGLDARAYFVQSDTSADSTAYVSRSGADLTLTDANAGTKNVQDLVSRVLGAVSSHQSIPDLVHFIGAPADGWATPYFVPVYTGPLLTQRTWYTSSGMSQIIFRQTLTYTGPLIASVVSVVYTSTGAVSKTVTDVYSYSGPVVASIARSSA